MLLAIGGACGAWDAAGLPQDYRVLHGLLLVVTATTFSTGFSLLCDSPRRARRLLEIAAAVLLAMLLLQASGSARGDALYSSIARSRSPHERVLSFARSLLDRDGDGFSAALGGGDCDDRDPSAYPLSTEGRDCLGWIDHSPRELTPLTRSLSVEIARRQPRIILLLTIDTFRCGFGSSDRSELRDVCPSLSALAREGSARLDAHSDYPVTARAMTILNTGDLHSNPAVPKVRTFYLASALHSLGYANEVIVTHPNIIADAGVKASFDEIDDSLVAVAREPSASTADEVSAHALARIEHAAAPLFLWAHYLDPHAPYVETPGERTHVSELDGYQAEVRRTDASIGRLADSLRARADADDILVILTADHGEEFGEHGGANHGKSLHEEATRVPMIVWSAGADHRAYGRGSLPSRTEEVAPFIMSLVGGGPFTSRGSTYLRTRPPGDAQIALVAGGWKLIYHQTLNYSELYHLAVDPAEIDDRADAEPGRVTKMGERLGGFFSPVQKPAAPLTADRPAGAPAG
ncbi:MAG TPA: sulfatase-like hydrolase/transferase [Polyangia bacterium]|nr:sulfatase-like hydrolase/transferase [Polyangia bacterium]